MDLNVTLYLFIAESIFFSALLIVCLKMASNKHRAHLNKLMSPIEKSEENKNEVVAEKKSIEDIRKQLFEQINNLHSEISELKKIKQKYERLKVRYSEMLNAYEKLKKKMIGMNKKDSNGGVNDEEISKKIKSINQAESSSSKINDGIEDYEQKISELKETIENLKSSLLECSIKGSPELDPSLKSIEKFSDGLNNSERATLEIKNTVQDLKTELDTYKKRVLELEEQETNGSNGDTKKSKYTIISKTANNLETNNDGISLEKDALDKFSQLQNEVETLRKSALEQRSVIFNLENEVKSLKKEINNGHLPESEQKEKQLQVVTLEKKLSETEGCIDILESEINYLSERLAEIEDKPLKMMPNNDSSQNTANKTITKPISTKNQIQNIVKSIKSAAIDTALELIATEILDALEPYDINVFLTTKSTLGEIEVAAKDDWKESDKSFIAEKLSINKFSSDISDNILKISSYHIGILAATLTEKDNARPIKDFEEPISILVLVANTVIDYFEWRKKSSGGSKAFKKVVDIAKTDAQKIAIQQRYQSSEAKAIVDNFLTDLNNSLNTMNITENQSAFFDGMITEVKDRMELLYSTQSSVDSDFMSMLGKLEKSGESIFH